MNMACSWSAGLIRLIDLEIDDSKFAPSLVPALDTSYGIVCQSSYTWLGISRQSPAHLLGLRLPSATVEITLCALG
jgi:hypothetical protein